MTSTNEAVSHHQDTISLGRYLLSSAFGNAVMENWQSEYLQFTLYILLTVWFVQKGSPESKQLGKQGRETDREQLVGEHASPESPAWARARGLRLWIYSNSLVLVMATIWLSSWFAQSVTGWSDYDSEQLAHGEHAHTYWQFSEPRISGRARCRTGSRSFSPSARWRSWRSTCASAAPPSQSPSAPPTRPRELRNDSPGRQSGLEQVAAGNRAWQRGGVRVDRDPGNSKPR
jgi:hypothetical protein